MEGWTPFEAMLIRKKSIILEKESLTFKSLARFCSSLPDIDTRILPGRRDDVQSIGVYVMFAFLNKKNYRGTRLDKSEAFSEHYPNGQDTHSSRNLLVSNRS